MTVEDVRQYVQRWLIEERSAYADVKYAEGTPQREALIEATRTEGYSQSWGNFAESYLKRAELFGLDTMPGRQALGKAITTLLHCLETAIDVHGPMPAPGRPSGEIVEDW